MCGKSIINDFKTLFEEKIHAAAALDLDSRLGAYLAINPSLSKPSYTEKLEFQRVYITRYRTGSHNLKIETGRNPYIPREERYCICDSGLQTVSHVLLHCPLLNAIRMEHGVVDVENGVMNESYLIEMERILGIK